jgi:hypothetical protein
VELCRHLTMAAVDGAALLSSEHVEIPTGIREECTETSTRELESLLWEESSFPNIWATPTVPDSALPPEVVEVLPPPTTSRVVWWQFRAAWGLASSSPAFRFMLALSALGVLWTVWAFAFRVQQIESWNELSYVFSPFILVGYSEDETMAFAGLFVGYLALPVLLVALLVQWHLEANELFAITSDRILVVRGCAWRRNSSGCARCCRQACFRDPRARFSCCCFDGSISKRSTVIPLSHLWLVQYPSSDLSRLTYHPETSIIIDNSDTVPPPPPSSGSVDVWGYGFHGNTQEKLPTADALRDMLNGLTWRYASSNSWVTIRWNTVRIFPLVHDHPQCISALLSAASQVHNQSYAAKGQVLSTLHSGDAHEGAASHAYASVGKKDYVLFSLTKDHAAALTSMPAVGSLRKRCAEFALRHQSLGSIPPPTENELREEFKAVATLIAWWAVLAFPLLAIVVGTCMLEILPDTGCVGGGLAVWAVVFAVAKLCFSSLLDKLVERISFGLSACAM